MNLLDYSGHTVTVVIVDGRGTSSKGIKNSFLTARIMKCNEGKPLGLKCNETNFLFESEKISLLVVSLI